MHLCDPVHKYRATINQSFSWALHYSQTSVNFEFNHNSIVEDVSKMTLYPYIAKDGKVFPSKTTPDALENFLEQRSEENIWGLDGIGKTGGQPREQEGYCMPYETCQLFIVTHV